ncbi:MAG: hypothetical protein IJA62_03950 [Ruminococcus sp.]|nr:hypothetical protein [Ruminococcus sp.]
MKERDTSIIKTDIPGLSLTVGKLISHAEFLHMSMSQLTDVCRELDSISGLESAQQLRTDTLNIIEQIKEALAVAEKTAKEFEFALDIYRENKQKTADIINAIEV